MKTKPTPRKATRKAKTTRTVIRWVVWDASINILSQKLYNHKYQVPHVPDYNCHIVRVTIELPTTKKARK